ncbi:MAG TPA: methyltransferase domain-containing protein [Nocardioidaceae bacterium]|nr:methyltransferase domain-containing protein [Nocardioidaceae bacterium]
MQWDPAQYLAFGDERARPFVELVRRIPADSPRSVVDLGCGPGTLTALLKQRWPAADVVGVDASPEMVAAADESTGVRFELGDIRSWQGESDVVVSNAALQWVPGHLALLPALAARARQWFAFQVPGNFEAPTHTIRRELAEDARYEPYLYDVDRPAAHDPEVYLDVLQRQGWTVDAWETTYLHVLHGEDAVFTWVSATGARPTMQALPDALRAEFVTEFKARLDEAYPPGPLGVVMPFRRVFVVAGRR